jgi:hypothetical protein
MTVIDGINVAVFNCDKCGGNKMLIFRGQNGEGYKIACLVEKLGIKYLWQKFEEEK